MTKKDAEKQAQLIYQETLSTIPVDLIAIARHYGIRVEYPDLEDTVSGMLLMRNGRIVIGVNENHADTRQRFTMAHELGHYFLHKNAGSIFVDEKKVLFRNSQSSDGTLLQEIHANAFAAALLMPEEQIKRYARKMIDLEIEADLAVWRLAETFQVSEEAMRRRLINLGYEVE